MAVAVVSVEGVFSNKVFLLLSGAVKLVFISIEVDDCYVLISLFNYLTQVKG